MRRYYSSLGIMFLCAHLACTVSSTQASDHVLPTVVKKSLNDYVLCSLVKPNPDALKGDQKRLEKLAHGCAVSGAKTFYNLLNGSLQDIEKITSRTDYQETIAHAVSFLATIGLVKQKIKPQLCSPEDIRMTLQDTPLRSKRALLWFWTHYETVLRGTSDVRQEEFFRKTNASNFNNRSQSSPFEIALKSNDGKPEALSLPQGTLGITFVSDTESGLLFLLFDSMTRDNLVYHGTKKALETAGSWLGLVNSKDTKIAGEYVPQELRELFIATVTHCVENSQDQAAIIKRTRFTYEMVSELEKLLLTTTRPDYREKITDTINTVKQCIDNYDFASGNEVALSYHELLMYSYLLSHYQASQHESSSADSSNAARASYDESQSICTLLEKMIEFQHVLLGHRQALRKHGARTDESIQDLRNRMSDITAYTHEHKHDLVCTNQDLNNYVHGFVTCIEYVLHNKACETLLRHAPLFKASYHAECARTLQQPSAPALPIHAPAQAKSPLHVTDEFFNS